MSIRRSHRKFDPTPVRRLYREKVAGGSGRAAADILSADDDRELPSGYMNASNSLQEQVISALNPNAARGDSSFGLSSPTVPTSPQRATPSPAPSAAFHLPQGPGKNAPARVKANPMNVSISEFSPPASRQSMLRSLEPSPTPMIDTTKPGWMLDMNVGFEQELEEIGRLNLQKHGDLSFATTIAPLGRIETTEERLEKIEKMFQEIPRQTPPPPATVDKHLKTHTGKPIHVPYTPDLRARPSLTTSVHTHVPTKPMVMRDYQLLAEACQRAGKARMEGHAYYKMGETLAQNPETLAKSVKYFLSYLNICRRLNDLQGEAKALNCLGIAHQEMGGEENLQKSLDYHRQHSEISDAAGIFIANTNMGLICGQLQNWQGAIMHHKLALQYAVKAGDKQAESLALANLGLMGRSQGDLPTAKACIERHLELAQELSDDQASLQANEQLGLLAVEKGDWSEASKLLCAAMELALKQDNQPKTNEMKCMIGVMNGNLKMEEHMRTIARTMGAKTEKKSKKIAVVDDQ